MIERFATEPPPALQGLRLLGWVRPEHLGAAHLTARKHPAAFDEVQRPPQFVRGQQLEGGAGLRPSLGALQGSESPLQPARTARCRPGGVFCTGPFSMGRRGNFLTQRTTSRKGALDALLASRKRPPAGRAPARGRPRSRSRPGRTLSAPTVRSHCRPERGVERGRGGHGVATSFCPRRSAVSDRSRSRRLSSSRCSSSRRCASWLALRSTLTARA